MSGCIARRNAPERSGDPFELLHKVGAVASLTSLLMNLHVDVAVGWVVVKSESSPGDFSAIDIQRPLATSGALQNGLLDMDLRCSAPHGSCWALPGRRFLVAKYDSFASNVFTHQLDHDIRKNVITLDFEELHPRVAKKGLKNTNGRGMEFRNQIEFE